MQGCQDMPLTIPRYSTTQKKVNTVMHYANSIAHYRNCVAHNKEKTLSLLGLDSRMILMIISLNKVYSKTIFSRYLVFSRYLLPCTDAQKVHTNTNISVQIMCLHQYETKIWLVQLLIIQTVINLLFSGTVYSKFFKTFMSTGSLYFLSNDFTENVRVQNSFPIDELENWCHRLVGVPQKYKTQEVPWQPRDHQPAPLH